jgi:hypothetical protein
MNKRIVLAIVAWHDLAKTDEQKQAYEGMVILLGCFNRELGIG